MRASAMRRLLGVAAALLLAGALAAPASAETTRSGNTFTASPALCSCWSTIDGYQFVGIPYPAAVDTWLELQAEPAYAPLPPVTSGSVELEVSGDAAAVGDACEFTDDATGEIVQGVVAQDGDTGELYCQGSDGRSSWGRSSWGF